MSKTQNVENVSRETFDKCPKCGVRPQSPGGNKWCLECRAEYQRNYRSEESIRARAEGFREGAEAMRQQILDGLRKAHPAGMMRAFEVSKYVTGVPMPTARTQSST